MNYSEQLSLDTPLRLFIRKLWYKFCQEGKEGQQKKSSFSKISCPWDVTTMNF